MYGYRLKQAVIILITQETIWKSMNGIRVVELFAGVGGLRVGLEKASPVFKTVWADQWEPGRKDQFAFKCYDSHFRDTGSVNVNEDINKVWQEVPEHDLLTGGFPCQDYSVASTSAKGIEGKKGVLWWNIHDIIRNRKPRYVLLENVDRLLRSPVKQRGRDFGIILRCLADDGYYVEWRVVNAAEYGLQQRRRRTFIFACRNDTGFAEGMSGEQAETVVSEKGFFARTFPVKETVVPSKLDSFSVSEAKCGDLVQMSKDFEAHFFNSGVMSGYEVYTRETEPDYKGEYVTLGSILQQDADDSFVVRGDELEKWKYMKGSKAEERHHSDGSLYFYKEGAIPFPDILDRAGRTMLTSEGTKNRSSHLILDPVSGEYRRITPLECERLNGFPDNWTDTGMSERQRYFCMGNALVVQLITMMGRTVAEIDRNEGAGEVRSVASEPLCSCQTQ